VCIVIIAGQIQPYFVFAFQREPENSYLNRLKAFNYSLFIKITFENTIMKSYIYICILMNLRSYHYIIVKTDF